MPYIEESNKIDLEFRYPTQPGELNYSLTSVILKYLETQGESYKTYNDIIGALECCKLELYRRKIAIYENKKIKKNGDVY